MRAADIERMLPGLFQQTLAPDQPLSALLAVMEALHQPAEDVLNRLDAHLDPRRAPDEFVTLLARWVDLDRLFREGAATSTTAGEGSTTVIAPERLRLLVRAAARLSQWRGTQKGLREFLELATGVSGFDLRENMRSGGKTGTAIAAPYHLWVAAPAAAEPHRPLIDRIVRSEKPAYMTHELTFG
jgi:phage tail-like protein